MFELTDALYRELKRGGQEPFKKKVLFKLNYCVGLLVLQGKSVEWILQRQQELVCAAGQHEMAYLLFTAVEGAWCEGVDVSAHVDAILERALSFISDNEGALTKSTNLK